MPLGTSTQFESNEPQVAYVVDDNAWNQTAKRTDFQVTSVADTGLPLRFALEQAGIACLLEIAFDGALTVPEGGSTPGDRWPYGLVDVYQLSLNKGVNIAGGLFGEDLLVRKEIAFPAYTDASDVFPSAIGGGSAIDAGTYPVHLSWQHAIATELVTCTGGIYAANPTTQVTGQINTNTASAALAALFSAGGSGTAITGTWTINEVAFDPGYDSQGRLIVPSGIANYHTMTAIDPAIPNTGVNRLGLSRGQGVLQRLYMAFRASDVLRLSAAPSAATDVSIDSLTLAYGSTQSPQSWDPASVLARQNNVDYGTPPSYDYLLIDRVKLQPTRDAIVYAGLTGLRVEAVVDSAVTLDAGTAHLVQEDLF